MFLNYLAEKDPEMVIPRLTVTNVVFEFLLFLPLVFLLLRLTVTNVVFEYDTARTNSSVALRLTVTNVVFEFKKNRPEQTK